MKDLFWKFFGDSRTDLSAFALAVVNMVNQFYPMPENVLAGLNAVLAWFLIKFLRAGVKNDSTVGG